MRLHRLGINHFAETIALAPIVILLPVLASCSSETDSASQTTLGGGTSSAGASSASGGFTAQSGGYSTTGGSIATGGMLASSGGRTSAIGGSLGGTGGLLPATGGLSSAGSGGSTAQSGGQSTTGGRRARSGGVTSATGGSLGGTGSSLPATGGSPSAGSGGSTAQSGGQPTTGGATGGRRSRTGGATSAAGGSLGGTGSSLPATGGSPSTGAGCSVTGQATGDFHLSTTDSRGTTRDFEVLVPTTYQSGVPLALTFVFHGAGGSEGTAIGYGLQTATGASGSSIFVFPQGVAYQNYGIGWDETCKGYDVAFFDNMLAAIQAKYCVDPNRVFVAGFSWGCDFVTALACCRGNRLRGVAAASCSNDFSNTSNYKTYGNYPCQTVTAAIRFTHDVAGDSAYSAADFAVPSQLYQALDSCSAISSPTTPSPCVAYQNCTHQFVECSYAGLGHSLPSDWPDATWSFLSTAQ
jgi:hypothetical protein